MHLQWTKVSFSNICQNFPCSDIKDVRLKCVHFCFTRTLPLNQMHATLYFLSQNDDLLQIGKIGSGLTNWLRSNINLSSKLFSTASSDIGSKMYLTNWTQFPKNHLYQESQIKVFIFITAFNGAYGACMLYISSRKIKIKTYKMSPSSFMGKLKILHFKLNHSHEWSLYSIILTNPINNKVI